MGKGSSKAPSLNPSSASRLFHETVPLPQTEARELKPNPLVPLSGALFQSLPEQSSLVLFGLTYASLQCNGSAFGMQPSFFIPINWLASIIQSRSHQNTEQAYLLQPSP